MASTISTATSTARYEPNETSSLSSRTTSSKQPQQQEKLPADETVSSRRSSKKYKHTFAVHADTRTSYLSHDSTVSPSFVGFRNLMCLALVASNLRLMIENFKKYGILLTFSTNSVSREDWRLGTLLYLLVPCHLFAAWIIELVAARYAQSAAVRSMKNQANNELKKASDVRHKFLATWWTIAALHTINATANLCIATYVVYYHIHNPGIGTLCELHAVIVWLKTCSYAFTNRDLRHALLLNPSGPAAPIPQLYESSPYPSNITVSNLCYFWWAPTLVYQPVYPRTSHIRWGFVAKRLFEVFALCIVIWVASAQYAVPLLQNSLNDISSLNMVGVLERVLKLSTISLVCWLAGFFALFQSFLNALAEVMRFGDREFYTDWWNVSNVRSYWTSWNKPVTNFMKRHIYSPLVGRGVPPTLAQILTFLFSGVLHELLVGIPTHNILGVAFAGMVLQLPLIFITDPLSKVNSINGKLIGNVIFWLTFCLFGQPLAALLYFFAWQAKYGTGLERPQYPNVFSKSPWA